MTTSNLKEFLSVTNLAADIARKHSLSGWEKNLSTEQKEDESEVTEIDRTVELEIRTLINDTFPSHDILGEEFGEKSNGASLRWILDPIDGTQNYARRIHTFGVLIALYDSDTPLVSCIDHPALNMRLIASKGEGTFLNNKKIVIDDFQDQINLHNQVLAVSTPNNFQRIGSLDLLFHLLKIDGTFRVYGDCYKGSLAIQGSIGAAFDVKTKFWDIAPIPLLVHEAGGICEKIEFSDSQNSELYSFVYGKPKMVRYVQRLLENFS